MTYLLLLLVLLYTLANACSYSVLHNRCEASTMALTFSSGAGLGLLEKNYRYKLENHIKSD